VLEGEIGKFATIARRSGDDWFLGSLTANHNKSVLFNPDFLQKGLDYEATIYTFDPDSESLTKVKIDKRVVNTETELNFEIPANSGMAMHIQSKL